MKGIKLEKKRQKERNDRIILDKKGREKERYKFKKNKRQNDTKRKAISNR